MGHLGQLAFTTQAFHEGKKSLVSSTPMNNPAPKPSPMNLVYVFADQWRAQAVGYAGDPNVQTPFLDALAKESLRFRCAVANVPVCCPSRATLLTGKMPHEHGVFLNDVRLRDANDSLGHRLNRLGYHTAWIGKWHLNGHGRSRPIASQYQQGFQHFVARECNHHYWNALYFEGPDQRSGTWTDYEPEAQTRQACDYLRQRADARQPFALFLSWAPPHDPYGTAPDRFRSMYDPQAIQLRDNVPSEHAQKTRNDLAGYYAHCSALDAQIGELLRTIDDAGLAGNTAFIFTSDHGDMLDSQGGRNKQQPWDESVLVPMLARIPGEASRDMTQPFGTVDTADALIALASGVEPRWQRPASLIASYAPFGQWDRRVGGRAYRGVRTEQHTYVRDLNGPWLLFDNHEDPYQLRNRIADRRLRENLENLLRTELDAVGDPFEPAEVLIQRWGYSVNEHGTVPFEW